jgi:hypothetical protein
MNKAVTDRAWRVVGVVINAIDDHLTRGDQIQVDWTLDSVLPLRQLLNVAAACGRTVHDQRSRPRTRRPPHRTPLRASSARV